MALFLIGRYYFSNTSSNAIEWIALETGLKSWLDKEDSGIIGFVFTMGGLILWIILMMLYLSIFKYVFLIFSAPLFTYLSEKTDAIKGGRIFSFNLIQMGKDIWRGIQIAIRNSLWQTVYILAIIFVSLIPIIGWLTPLMTALVEFYYFGFSMLDYSMGRNNKSVPESIFFIGNHKGLAIGNGIVFYLMHIVPILGWIFPPVIAIIFAMPLILAPTYAVVAATLSLYPPKENTAYN